MTTPRLKAIGEALAEILAEVGEEFVPEARLTLLVRHPDYPDGSADMLITCDDIEAIVRAVKACGRSDTRGSTVQ